MACFGLGVIEQLLIWLIIIIAIVAIIRLLIPVLDSMTGIPIIGRVLEIVLWAVVAIMILYVIFGLLGCLLGSGGGLHFPAR
jgi:hypothetical protein